MQYFPGYAWPGAGGSGPPAGRFLVQSPVPSPLSALAHTPLAPHLAQILAQAPYLAQPGGLTPQEAVTGDSPIPMPPRIAGMPVMPPPPPGMFGGEPSPAGLLGSAAPVMLPQWFVEQQQRLGTWAG